MLIHAGDLTGTGTFMQLKTAGEWLASLPHKHKLVVAGNHDFLFQKDYNYGRYALGDESNGIQYLQDQITVIDDVVFYGAPWSVYYNDWAFGAHPGSDARKKWSKMPQGVDVLISHGPPYGILDQAPNGYKLGCKDLLEVVKEFPPKLHVFGHIHHSHGTAQVGDTLFVNAAICDESYKHTQEPIVLDYRNDSLMLVRPGPKR